MSKLTRPTVRIHNQETDEVIDREMNDAEFVKYQADRAAKATEQAEADAKAIAKQTIADRLGLTADELKLLLG